MRNRAAVRSREWARKLGVTDRPYDRQVVHHAGADALIQPYAQNDGIMPGSLTLHTDNPPCSACCDNLGAVAREMGITDLRIEVSDGSVWTMNAAGDMIRE